MTGPRRWERLNRLAHAVHDQARARRAGCSSSSAEPELRQLVGEAVQGFAEHVGQPTDSMMGAEWSTPSPYKALEWLLLQSGLVVPLPDARAFLLELEAQGPPARVPVREDQLGATSIPWWAGEVVRDRLQVSTSLHRIVAQGGFTAGECTAAFPGWRHADRILDRLVDLEDQLGHAVQPPPAVLEA